MRPQDELKAQYQLARDGYYTAGDGLPAIAEWVVGEDGALSGIRVQSAPQPKRRTKPKHHHDRRKTKAARKARRTNR